MQLDELETPRHPHGQWIVDWSRTGECDYNNIDEVIKTHRPVLQISLREMFKLPLKEMTYRDIAARIDPNFLRQGIRAKALRGLRYETFDGDTMKFWVTSSEIQWNGIEYLNLVKFLSWDEIGGDANMTPREKALNLLWTSDIQLYCNDPSFIFWGFAYILTQMNASIYPESRFPHIRNPGLRNVVCKHLNRILRSLPFYNGDIAKAIIEQWGGQIDQKAIDAIRRRADLQKQANEGMNLPPEAEPIPPPELELPSSPEDQQDASPELDPSTGNT